MRSLEAGAAERFAGLEGALLKGLHAISAKTAAGLEASVAREVCPVTPPPPPRLLRQQQCALCSAAPCRLQPRAWRMQRSRRAGSITPADAVSVYADTGMAQRPRRVALEELHRPVLSPAGDWHLLIGHT